MKKKVKMNSGCECDKQDRLAEACATYIKATISPDEIKRRLKKVFTEEQEILSSIIREIQSSKKI